MLALVLVASPVPDGGARGACPAGNVAWKDDCLEEGGWTEDPVRCAGGMIVAHDGGAVCVKCEDIEAQQPLNLCLGREAARVDGALNVAYKALAHDAAAHLADLRKQERAWIKKRDATCAEEVDVGGSAAAGELASCQIRETQKRIAELAALRKKWLGH